MADRLSARSAWKLIDQLRQRTGKTASGTGTARVTRIDRDGTTWVSIPGGSSETPVNGVRVANVRPGDTVTYRIAGGRLSVTGSMTDPAVGDRQVEQTVAPVRETANRAETKADDANGLAKAAKDVADAINQYFWADGNGVHVSTEEANPEGEQNVLLNALGMLFRKGANNLLALVTGNSPGVLIYDGEGNADANIIASFVGNLIELGRNSTSAVIKFCGGKGMITYETGYDWMDIEADEGIHVSYQAKHKYSDLDPHWVSPARGTVQSDVRLVYADGNQYDTSTTWAIEAGMLMDASLNWHDDSAFLWNLHRAFVGAYTGNAETGYGTEDYVEEVPSRVEVGGRLLRVYVPEAVVGAGDIDTTFDMRNLVEVLKMVKTAGDTITATGLRIGGYITSNKTECKLTIHTPFRFYGVTSCTISGSYTVRQGGNYLFGSTATTPYTFTGHYTIDSINSDLGTINVTINTGVAQSAATNNDPANIVLNSCTITLS